MNGIKKIADRINARIRKIQRSEERVKRNWLIASSALTMLLVIFAWVGYVGILVPKVEKSSSAAEAEEMEKTEKQEGSFFVTLRKGLGIVAEDADEKISDLGDYIEGIYGSLKSAVGKSRDYFYEKPDTKELFER